MSNNIKSVKSHGSIKQLQHNFDAKARQVLLRGFVIGTNKFTDLAGIHNDANTAAVRIGENKILRVTNRNAAVQYISFGAAGVAVPTGLDGVPIPISRGVITISTGDFEYIRTSSVDVHIVEIDE